MSQPNLQLRKQRTTSCVLTSWKQFSRELFKMDVWYSSFFYFSMTMLFILVDRQWLKSIIKVNKKYESAKTVKTGCCTNGDAHLIVTIAGDLDARLPHFHVHHQTFHHRQRVLVVTEVLRQNKAKRRAKEGVVWTTKAGETNQWRGDDTVRQNQPAAEWNWTERGISGRHFLQRAFYANTSHRENSYCQQIHDGVTGLSKQGFSEADAEQRTWVDCKRKKNAHSLMIQQKYRLMLLFNTTANGSRFQKRTFLFFYNQTLSASILSTQKCKWAAEQTTLNPPPPPRPQHTHKA